MLTCRKALQTTLAISYCFEPIEMGGGFGRIRHHRPRTIAAYAIFRRQYGLLLQHAWTVRKHSGIC